MVLKMFTKLGKRMDKIKTSMKRDREHKYQKEVIELKNTITELKTSLEGFNSKLIEEENGGSEI